MKVKIIATIMALGMVLTGFSMLAMAADTTPTPTGAPEAILSRVNPAVDGTRNALVGNVPNGIAHVWLATRPWALTSTVVTYGVNTKGITIDIPGTWTYNLAYGQCSADAGVTWDVWVAGEYTTMVYETFNDQTATRRNYTMIYEQTVVGTGSTNYGANTVQNALTPINNPVVAGTWHGNNTAMITIANQVTGYEVATLNDGYRVFKSTTGPITQGNQGVALGDAAVYGANWVYYDAAWTANSYYAVKKKWDGGTTAFNTPLYSYGMSNGTYALHDAANTAPVAGAVLTAPNPHNGNIVSEQVTITATITDVDLPAQTLSAEYSVDGGATWTAFAQTGVTPLAVSAVYAFPWGYQQGAHGLLVRGFDGIVNSVNAVGSIVVTDITAPVITTNVAPAATIYATQSAMFRIGYGDFCAYNPLVASSYFRYKVGVAGAWNTFAWNNVSFAFGSYTNVLGYDIAGGTFAVGDVVYYEGRVTDTAAAPNIGAWAGGSFTVLATPPGVQDPYVIFGRLYLYAGTFAGGYTPLISAGGPVVTATWISSFNGATLTRPGTVNALGQFSIDLLNYTTLSNVMLTATFNAPYLNQGSNYTQIDIAGFPGSREQNVVCGVPYSFTITAPLAASNQQAGMPFPASYVIRDRQGLTAQGYYTFNDGNTRWTSGDVAFVPPPTTQFNGLGGGNGVGNNVLTLNSGGPQWINISETVCDWWPTPWNNFQVMTGFAAGVPVYTAGWLRDFDNITVNVLASTGTSLSAGTSSRSRRTP
jgi:hypothetical protein